jgi:large subunit ribosomal protein L28
MSKRCAVTGKGVMVGNNVSHANNKTRRRFEPNLQVTSVYSDALKRSIRLRLSTQGLRTLEHKGGVDAFVMAATASKLTPELRKLRKQIEAAQNQGTAVSA